MERDELRESQVPGIQSSIGQSEVLFYLKCSQKPLKDLKQRDKCSHLGIKLISLAALQRID